VSVIERHLSDMPFATISQVTAAGGPGKWAFVQGQLALDEDWHVSHAPIGEQTKICFAHIADALSKVGGTLADILKLTIYVTDMDKFPEVNAARAELFGTELPVSTAVEVSGLYGGAEIEIEAFAFVPAAP
jgi:enamine deaminase RidA (YjgF/YER057c/UK114 family)